MQDLIESGNIVFVMLAVIAVEIVVLVGYWQRTGRGVKPFSLLVNIGAGGSLMLALGSTLKGFDWTVTAAMLVMAAVFHFLDVKQRWS